MGKQLNITVHVDGVRYDPGQDIPPEVAKKITNPDVWAKPTNDSDGDEDAKTSTPPLNPDAKTATSDGKTSEPGAGERPKLNATREAWAEYAAKLTPAVAVNGTMSRDEIIAAVDQAQKAAQDS